MSSEAVKCVVDGAVARLVINRPEKRNAINVDVVVELGRHLDDLALRSDVRVITLSGEGACFSAGIDVTAVAGLGGVDETERGLHLRELARKIQHVINRIETLEKPVIAVLHSHALGLAMEIVLACDFRIAAEDLRFGLPEIYLGLIPDCGGTTRLTRMVGPAVAKELILLGDAVDAQTALSLRIVNEVCTREELEARTAALVERLVARPARALGLAKRMIDWSTSMERMTSFDTEVMAQTAAVSAPDFPQILATGVMTLRAKKH